MTEIEGLLLLKLPKVDFNTAVYITNMGYVYQNINTTKENLSIIEITPGNTKR